jgi:hypothetical protein
MLVCQDRAQTILRVIDVLILVDEDVAELVLITRPNVFDRFEQLDRLGDEVVEIGAV